MMGGQGRTGANGSGTGTGSLSMGIPANHHNHRQNIMHGKRMGGKYDGKSDVSGSVLGEGSMTGGSSVHSKMTSMFGLGLGRGNNAKGKGSKGESNEQGTLTNTLEY